MRAGSAKSGGTLWFWLSLILDLLCAFFCLVCRFVRGALAGLLDLVPGFLGAGLHCSAGMCGGLFSAVSDIFGGFFSAVSGIFGRLFSVVSGIFNVLFCAFLRDCEQRGCDCNQQNQTEKLLAERHRTASSCGVEPRITYHHPAQKSTVAPPRCCAHGLHLFAADRYTQVIVPSPRRHPP